MAVPSTIADLDTVAANNSPQGSDSIGTSLDDYLRSHAAIIKKLYADLLDGTVDVHTALNATTATTASNGVLPGTIIDWAGTSAPSGYLACPLVATNISRTTYATLFAAIGTTWGAGDGSTTFGMPYFPADYVAGQANGNVGTATAGQNLAHTHLIDSYVSGSLGSSGRPQEGASGSSDSFTTLSNGGSANLAASMRVMKCVKY